MPNAELEALLDFLKRSRGFDFTGYKRSSLERRVRKRMEAVGIEEISAYQDHLEVDPDEFPLLFNTILINVTGFFRDPDTWDVVANQVLPDLVTQLPEDRPLRVWSAGCASGEETYTLAMLLAEALGERAFLERVKIYATDADEQALAEARAGSFTAEAVQDVPEALRDRYFERVEQRHVFRKDLRRVLIFGRNDLVQDAPISRVDLLSCRNTLMYFNAQTQARILPRFHFALSDRGYLLLGKSEMLLTQGRSFKPISPSHRIFTKVQTTQQARARARVLSELDPAPDGASAREEALEHAPVAQVVLDAGTRLLTVNRAARDLFGVDLRDVGRPLKDLELSYRPVELRGPVESALADQRPQGLGLAPYAPPGRDQRTLDVTVVPMLRADQAIGVSIIFADVTRERTLTSELEDSTRGLEAAYEELQSTVEELETTNEELQSANEELETTNEELQSANEELETMNEELQSTNEELETINEELRQRTRDLDELNLFLETILTSIGLAVAVVDRELAVTAWNRLAVDLWGLLAEEVIGHHLLNLDIGLPVSELRPLLRTVIADPAAREVVTLEAVNRRGRTISCRVTCLPLRIAGERQPGGSVVLMESLPDPGPPAEPG